MSGKCFFVAQTKGIKYQIFVFEERGLFELVQYISGKIVNEKAKLSKEKVIIEVLKLIKEQDYNISINLLNITSF